MKHPSIGIILPCGVGMLLAATALSSLAGNGCGTPAITSPATPIVLAERPEIEWSEVADADQYRVQVSLRVPEGPLLGSYDVNLATRRFQLPQALPAAKVLVVARVSAHCRDKGFGPPSSPSTGGRFLALSGRDCPAPTILDDASQQARGRLAWRKVDAASGYELVHFNQTTGLPMASWKTGQPWQEIAPPAGDANLYGLRSLCGGQAGPWRFVRLAPSSP